VRSLGESGETFEGRKKCNFERKDGLAIARRLPDFCYAYLRWDRVTGRKILKTPAFSISSFHARRSEWTVGVSAFGDSVIFSPGFRNRFTCIATPSNGGGRVASFECGNAGRFAFAFCRDSPWHSRYLPLIGSADRQTQRFFDERESRRNGDQRRTDRRERQKNVYKGTPRSPRFKNIEKEKAGPISIEM